MTATLTARQRAGLAVVIAQLLCVSIVGAATNATAAEAAVRDQAGWLAVGIAAVVTSAVLNGTWLLGLRRAVGLRRRAVLRALDGRAEGFDGSRADDDGMHVVVQGRTLVHRRGCPLVQGKATTPAEGSGPSCGWCTP